MPPKARNKLSRQSKELFMSYCESTDVHSELNVTYRDVAQRIMGWLSKQPIEIWNEVIKIMDYEIIASRDKCFTGKLSRLISCIDGFHPGVRIVISTADQVSNRVLSVINRGKTDGIENEEIITIVLRELRDLELNENQINEWMDTVRETLDE
jgi:hypothetical protein